MSSESFFTRDLLLFALGCLSIAIVAMLLSWLLLRWLFPRHRILRRFFPVVCFLWLLFYLLTRTVTYHWSLSEAKAEFAATRCNEILHAVECAQHTGVLDRVDQDGVFARLLEHNWVRDVRDITDPWGTRFRVGKEQGRFFVYSCGPDGEPETYDDIRSD